MKKIYRVIFLVILLAAGGIYLHIHRADRYSIRGVDVSHHQGQVDWEVLKEQQIDFAFIKATEGSSHVDECYTENLKSAKESGLIVGAYHFFSFDTAGASQASNFIQNAGMQKDMLPPVVDVELYGKYAKKPQSPKKVKKNLTATLEQLEETYHVKPIIYCTMKSYRLYIKDQFDDYPLWIRNVYYTPNLDLRKRWTFWQYTDKAVLDGYGGNEKYIDMNVFRGTIKQLKDLCIKE